MTMCLALFAPQCLALDVTGWGYVLQSAADGANCRAEQQTATVNPYKANRPASRFSSLGGK